MYYVYILSNRWRTVFYTGLTNDIQRRMFQHKTKFFPKAFTAMYNCDNLLYYEVRTDFKDASMREQEIKRLRREYKMQLITGINPNLIDLARDWGAR
jgi:putative endonuclease